MLAIFGSEDCEDTVADELQHVSIVGVNCRDDDVGVIVQQRNDLLGRRIGDAREAAQVAEPDDGVDAISDPAHDTAAEHTMPRVAAEISLHQRCGHARERGRLDRQRKRRNKLRKGSDMDIGETLGVRCHPRGVDAVHFADRAFGGKAIDDGNVVGHAVCPVLPKHRKLGFVFRHETAPQQAFPGLQHVEERAALPARDVRRPFDVGGKMQIRRIARQSGAPIFVHDGLRRIVPPTDDTAFVHRMKRVDEEDRA
jgi:hypothetical protein